MTLLRQYGPDECGPDGYPVAWHQSTAYGPYPAGTPRANPAIKDLIREQAGHRCQRCGHPYRKGEHGNGEWSPCDKQCEHLGPARVREARLPSDAPWKEVVLDQWAYSAAEARMDEGPHGPMVRWEVEAKWRILTVHHLDEDKANCRWWNLAALCQRCHLRMQRAVVMDRPYYYEHSEWFRPYAAGFYSWKYLRSMIGENDYLELPKGLRDLYAAMREDESPTPTLDRCFRRTEDRELTREETMERLDELLALEHRFTQEAIF